MAIVSGRVDKLRVENIHKHDGYVMLMRFTDELRELLPLKCQADQVSIAAHMDIDIEKINILQGCSRVRMRSSYSLVRAMLHPGVPDYMASFAIEKEVYV